MHCICQHKAASEVSIMSIFDCQPLLGEMSSSSIEGIAMGLMLSLAAIVWLQVSVWSALDRHRLAQ